MKMKTSSRVSAGVVAGASQSSTGARGASGSRRAGALTKNEPEEVTNSADCVVEPEKPWVSVKMEGLLITDLMHQLHRRSTKLVDTHVICSDGYIPIHRCVLMAASPFLAELLLKEV